MHMYGISSCAYFSHLSINARVAILVAITYVCACVRVCVCVCVCVSNAVTGSFYFAPRKRKISSNLRENIVRFSETNFSIALLQCAGPAMTLATFAKCRICSVFSLWSLHKLTFAAEVNEFTLVFISYTLWKMLEGKFRANIHTYKCKSIGIVDLEFYKSQNKSSAHCNLSSLSSLSSFHKLIFLI